MLAAFHDHRRLSLDKRLVEAISEDESLIDQRAAPNRLEPQLFFDKGRLSGVKVRVDTDNQPGTALTSKLKKPHVTGVKHIKQARNENVLVSHHNYYPET
jgi:hypothetical protein